MSIFRLERPFILFLKVLFYPFAKIRNMYYSIGFSCRNLILGKNVSISGSRNIKIGNRVIIGNQNWLDAIGDGQIIIGDDVSFSQNVHIAACKLVTINDGCLIGSDVLITDHDHSFGRSLNVCVPKLRPLVVKGPTILGDNIWVGDNVKILTGVSLGNNVVVAANSVVISSFPSDVIIGGIPARIIKEIV